MELKLGDIVERARLNRHTAQHVLKYGDADLGLPKGEDRGIHRTFSLKQARRLAIASKLVAGWVKLDGAVRAVRYCEDRVREFIPRDGVADELFVRPVTDPWYLHVYDERFAKLWCKGVWQKAKPLTADVWLDIESGRRVWGETLEDPVGWYVLDLTLLERRLRAGGDA